MKTVLTFIIGNVSGAVITWLIFRQQWRSISKLLRASGEALEKAVKQNEPNK